MSRHFSQYGLFYAIASMLLSFCAALQAGPTRIDFFNAFQSMHSNIDSLDALILLELRLPRALLALTVGATLGLSGAALQGLLRNPLAGPGLVGVSNGAALGAVIALYFGLSQVSQVAVPFMGMVGAAISVVLVFILAGKGSSITTLLLAGVAVNALTASLIALALNFSPNPYAMSEIVFWLLGSIANRSLLDVALSLPFMIAGWVLLFLSKKYLTSLSLGEKTAETLGFHSERQKLLVIVGVALSVGAAVSVSGSIGFIGLVVPHLIRPFVRFEPGRLLLLSAVTGAIFLLWADIFVQVISPNQEIKLGVVTALVGGPFFLYLIVKTRNTLQ